MDQLALMHRIMVLLSGHYPAQLVDVVFIFGRARRDFEATKGDDGILGTAAKLYHHSLARYVSFPGTKGHLAVGGAEVTTTYPGPETFGRLLNILGVPPADIIPTDEAPPHTRGDSDAFVTLAQRRGWSRAAAIMHHHQALRAFLGLIKSFEKCGFEPAVLPVYPRRTNWSKPVFGSQGALLLPRHEHIAYEWERIVRYQAQGDLASFEELDAYLTRSLTANSIQ